MSIWSELAKLEKLEHLEIKELERIEHWLEKQWHRHHPRPHPKRIVSGRFGGLYVRNPLTGEITMALQKTDIGVAYTGPVQFFLTDGSLATTPGPAGVLSVDNPLVTVGLSADSQSYNVTTTATLGTGNIATITWHDPAGVVPDFTTQVSDEAPANVIVSGGFGPLVPGTTP